MPRSATVAKRMLLGLALGLATRGSRAEDAGVAALEARFQPDAPTVTLSYGVAYRFLFLTIARMANAAVESTPGRWRTASAATSVPAVLLSFRVDSLDDPAANQRGRISLHNRIVAVLSLPALDTLLYVKQADEHINPLFRGAQEARYLEVYDLESGFLKYSRTDYLKGTVRTDPSGRFDPARLGREIPTALTLISEVYGGKRAPLDASSDVRLEVTVDGTVTPFVLTTHRDRTRLHGLRGAVPSLRVEATPAPDAGGRGKPVCLWAAPLGAVAERAGRTDVQSLAAGSPDWHMVPLIADYGLAVGYVRAHLTAVGTQDRRAEVRPSAAPGP